MQGVAGRQGLLLERYVVLVEIEPLAKRTAFIIGHTAGDGVALGALVGLAVLLVVDGLVHHQAEGCEGIARAGAEFQLLHIGASFLQSGNEELHRVATVPTALMGAAVAVVGDVRLAR